MYGLQNPHRQECLCYENPRSSSIHLTGRLSIEMQYLFEGCLADRPGPLRESRRSFFFRARARLTRILTGSSRAQAKHVLTG